MDDQLGDRMKAYERAAEPVTLDPLRPIYARIDGRAFTALTRGLAKPYDHRFAEAMRTAALSVMDDSDARVAYVQSDEISLVWLCTEPGQTAFFAGRPQKMASVLAGRTTAAFLRALMPPEAGLSHLVERLPHFDARVCQLPDRGEATAMIRWRALDARRNAINGLGRSKLSAKAMHGLPARRIEVRLAELGTRLDDTPPAFRDGVLLYRQRVERGLTEAERARIPRHKRPPADHTFERRVIEACTEISPTAVANLEAVLFEMAPPTAYAAVEA